MASCRNCGHTEKMCKCGGGRMSKAQPYPPPPRPNPNVTEPYPDEDHYFGGGLRPGRNPRITNSSRKPTRTQSAYPPMGPERQRYFPPGLRFMGPVGKSMQKGSISVPDKLKSMINGLLGVGRFDNVNPSAVAAALIANRQGGTLGMENFAPRKSPSSIGPRKSDVINTINALISRQRVRDPENPNFIPFKQRETLRRERMPSSGSGLDKSLMKGAKHRYNQSFADSVQMMVEDAARDGRRTTQVREEPNGIRVGYNYPEYLYQRFIGRGGRGQGGMTKSISSMNQGGVRHVVGGYRGGKMSKAMAASQTQTKNRYM